MSRSDEHADRETRRRFLCRGIAAAGALGMAGGNGLAAESPLPGRSHFAGKAKHVIYLHMVGAPSQIDLFDYKPKMEAWYDKDLPDSVRQGQRLTTMTSGQSPVDAKLDPPTLAAWTMLTNELMNLDEVLNK